MSPTIGILNFLIFELKLPNHPLQISHGNVKRISANNGIVDLFTASSEPSSSRCILCKQEKYQLYTYPRLRSTTHDEKVSTLKSNYLGHNHFVKQCKSLHRCKQCQKPHHTLLHVDSALSVNSTPAAASQFRDVISSNTAIRLMSTLLLMTCRVLVSSPDGISVEPRALLDNVSSASFISERLAQGLCLPRANQNAEISGIAGLTHKSPLQSVLDSLVTLTISPVKQSTKKENVTAVVVPQLTCDSPFHPISFKAKMSHRSSLQLTDPGFGYSGKINLLGMNVFIAVLLHGWKTGSPGSPVAFETHFEWVLAGGTDACAPTTWVATYHACMHLSSLVTIFSDNFGGGRQTFLWN